MNRPHDGIFKALKICLLTVTCIGSLSFCNSRIFSPSSVRGVSQKSNDPPKLVWISLDALNAEILKPYLDRFKSSHPRGLKWLLSQPNGNLGLKVGYPSITAPSHISTMTCARPGAHGVFLNAGNWNGTKDQSGFAMPYSAQTWVQALRSNLKRVGVAAYPSVDGSAEGRSADLGISYDSPQGKVQYISVSSDADAVIDIPSRLIPGKSYRFLLKLQSDGMVVASSDFSGQNRLPIGRAIDNFGFDGSDSAQRQASVSMMNLGVQGASIVVAVSPLSMSAVTGDAYRADLDQKKIVWSNLRDYGYSKYQNGVALTLETIRHRRHVELAAIKEMINAGHLDALFLYFEDIDVILHAWIGLSQYDSQLTDFLQEFDQEIGQLIASLSEDTNLVVMGDHGMSAVQYELNVRKLLPAGAAQSFQIRSSGGSLLLYPAGPLNTEVPAGLNLAGVAQSLREVTVEFDHHRKVFRRVILRDSDEARSLGLSGPSSPWIMAFADEGIALTDKLDQELLVSRRETFLIPQDLQAKYPDPMNSGRLVQPTPLGAHGHDSELSSMRTSLILLGPNLGGIDGSSLVSTVDVVPAVAEALGWVRPAACL